MKESLEPSGLPPALSTLPCSAAAGAWRGRQDVFHGEGGVGSSPARVNPETLENPDGYKADGSGATDWEQGERPGPPPYPYSVTPGTEQPCRAAGLAASGLDHPRTRGSMCAANSGPGQFLQLCLPRGSLQQLAGWWLCSVMVTQPQLEEPTSLVLFSLAGEWSPLLECPAALAALLPQDRLLLCIQRFSCHCLPFRTPALWVPGPFCSPRPMLCSSSSQTHPPHLATTASHLLMTNRMLLPLARSDLRRRTWCFKTPTDSPAWGVGWAVPGRGPRGCAQPAPWWPPSPGNKGPPVLLLCSTCLGKSTFKLAQVPCPSPSYATAQLNVLSEPESMF